MDIILSKSSKKFIESQNSTIKKRIKKGLDGLPEGDVKKLKGEDNLFRLRIGDIQDYLFIYR